MNRVLNYLSTEPVRVRLYGLVVLVIGYLKARGVLGEIDAQFAGSLAVIILAVESIRSKVTPMAYIPKHRD